MVSIRSPSLAHVHCATYSMTREDAREYVRPTTILLAGSVVSIEVRLAGWVVVEFHYDVATIINGHSHC